MLKRIFAFTLLISTTAYAADTCDSAVIEPGVINSLVGVSERLNTTCPNQLNPGQLCNAVNDQVEETVDNIGTRFNYQTRIYRAACVEQTDSPGVVQAKIQNFWNQYHSELNCNLLGFSVRGGSILKLAVERDSSNFINDAVRRWKVNLNHVDSVDNKTVLDFIEAEMTRSRGTPNENIMRRYHNLFRTNGAKYSREI